METLLRFMKKRKWNRKLYRKWWSWLSLFILKQMNFISWVNFWSWNTIWLESLEVRTSRLKRFSYRNFQISVQDCPLLLIAQALSLLDLLYVWFFRICGTLWMPGGYIILHLKRINSFEVYLMWIRNSTASMYIL